MPATQSRLLLDVVGGLPLNERQAVWLLWAFVGGLLLWSRQRRGIPPGWRRLATAAPFLLINSLIPLIFNGQEEVLANFATAVATAFITNFKLVAWVLGRGALVRPLTAAQFAAVYALPITQTAQPPADVDISEASSESARAPQEAAGATGKKADGEDSQAKARRYIPAHQQKSYSTSFLLGRFFLKAVLLTWVAIQLRKGSHTGLILLVLECLSQVLILSISADGLGAVVGPLLGLSIAPHFENPYMSVSVADFWNHRWNLVVSNILRACVYDPIMDGRLVARPGEFARFSRTRRLAAVFSVFVVSGLVHEWLFWYQSGRTTPHLLWFWHFVLWGVIVVAENVGKKVFRKMGLQVPTLVGRILFLILLHVMLGTFWIPPLKQMGVIDKGADSIVMGWEWLKRNACHALAAARA